MAKRRTTKEYRDQRRLRCMEYLRRAGNLPAARKLAAQDHFFAQTSAWIGAVSALLEEVSPDE